MYTEIVDGQTHIPRNNMIVAVLNVGHDEFNIDIGIFVDWLQSLKQFFNNVSYHILVASLTLMAL